jgi:uncharacterized protein YhaN
MTINEVADLEQINKDLEYIRSYLEKEMLLKQKAFEKSESNNEALKKTLEEKNTEITNLLTKLQEIQQASEGNRQIINKLLNDISHYQKDIDWYKRTYEKRSLLGTIKEKLFRKH